MHEELDPVRAARDLACHRFGAAQLVIVGGSVLTPRRTPTSDLDMLVVTAPRERATHHAMHWQGWPVEVLEHDERTLSAACADQLARRWPGVPRLIAEGVILADRRDLGSRLQEEMRGRLAAGPAAATGAELAAHRFELTDLLDDLTGSTDPSETAFISARLLSKTAQLALLEGRHWQGTGKWLLRELREHDPRLAEELSAALADPVALRALANQVLDRAGGPLREGYRTAL